MTFCMRICRNDMANLAAVYEFCAAAAAVLERPVPVVVPCRGTVDDDNLGTVTSSSNVPLTHFDDADMEG